MRASLPDSAKSPIWPPRLAGLTGGPAPLYYQVREALLQDLRGEQLQPGDRFPTEAELIERFGVSRTTVREALSDLTRAGLILRKPGKGTFVAQPQLEQELERLTGFVEDMQALGLTASSRLIGMDRVAADAKVAVQLGLPVGTTVVRIERVRLANNEPISFDVTFLPAEIGMRMTQENLAVDPIFTLLEVKYGLALADAEYRIAASTADRRVARLLGVATGSAILLVERTSHTVDGQAVDFEYLHYRGDRLRYSVRLVR